MAKAKSPVPQGLHTVTPHLILDDAATAIDWYKRGFGADEISRSAGPDGKIMHAEIRIGNSHLYLNDAMGGGKGPKALGGSPVGLWLYVDDADAMFDRAVSAGATVAPGPMGQMQDQFWGDRCGTLIDPAGFQWTIATRKEDLTPDELNRRADEFFKQFASMAKE
jgi:PhnB protein